MRMCTFQSWMICLATAIVGSSALAQTEPAVASPETLMAQRLAHIARFGIEHQSDSIPERLEQALILMDQATALQTDDGELWRWKIDAIDLAGRSALLRPALEGYLRCRPGDDVAWLRLMLLLAESHQTVEERLAFYESLLRGKPAERFSQPLRSRLQYRAALLYREQGDDPAYLRALRRSIQLDEVNKEAVAEAYRWIMTKPSVSPDEQAKALLNLLHADPADPVTHAEIGQLMLRCGDYQSAALWFGTAMNILRGLNQPPSINLLHDQILARWGAGDVGIALQLIDMVEQMMSQSPVDEEGGIAADGGLPVDLQQLRVAILRAQGREDEAVEAFNNLRATLRANLAAQPDDPKAMMDLVWVCLLFNLGIEDVAPLLRDIEPLMSPDSPAWGRLDGWWELRLADQAKQVDQQKYRMRLEKSRRILEPLAERDSLAALGLCYVLAWEGDFDALQTWQKRVYHDGPDRLYGVLAIDMSRRYGVKPDPLPQWVSASAIIARVPQDLQTLALQGTRAVQLGARATGYRFEYGEPLTMDVVLVNVSRWPLSLGPEGTIPTRVFLTPTAESPGGDGPQRLLPNVIDLHRTFRLDPRESAVVRARVDVGMLHAMLSAIPYVPYRTHVSAVLNPQMGPAGETMPGLLGSEGSLRNLERVGWLVFEQSETGEVHVNAAACHEQLNHIGSADRSQSMLATAKLLSVLPRVTENQSELRFLIHRAILGSYARMSAMEQAWVVSFINDEAQGMEEVLKQASESEDTLVRLVFMATQPLKADAPVISQALGEPDGPIRRFAHTTRILAERNAAREAEAEDDEGLMFAPERPAGSPGF